MPPPECSLPAPGLSSGARETAPARGAPCHGDLTGGGDSMSGSARPPPLTRLALLAQRAHERRGERHRARPAHRERPRTLLPVRPPPGAPWRWQTASSPQRTSQGGRTTGTSHAAVVSNARKEALISSRGGGAGQLGIWRQRRWRAAFDLKYRS